MLHQCVLPASEAELEVGATEMPLTTQPLTLAGSTHWVPGTALQRLTHLALCTGPCQDSREAEGIHKAQKGGSDCSGSYNLATFLSRHDLKMWLSYTHEEDRKK